MLQIGTHPIIKILQSLSDNNLKKMCSTNSEIKLLCTIVFEERYEERTKRVYPKAKKIDTWDTTFKLNRLYDWLVKINKTPYRLVFTRESLWSTNTLYIERTNKEIPNTIGILKNLEKLEIRSCGFNRLPKEIGNLKNLRNFKMDSVCVDEIPKEIGQLVNLEILTFDSIDIKSIPKEIDNLINLKELVLVNNRNLLSIPSEIKNLTKLKKLVYHAKDSNYNYIKLEFPQILNQMEGVKVFYTEQDYVITPVI